ncbi:putative enzyme related to lactoylglutathione lyase [Hamadaea flava]|uniref:VOC family protein n=1 Tax=Hamadaea flava TaxID=1742688 RepID=A0ABV8LG73_9ACTN|nr:VOC family protein [Hamadaea flava]MCP2326664.1 putative enzyme related to lactoylglutathione lyase [Hamadaea flava]
MRVTAAAISLNVADPVASAKFAQDHFGFTEDMAADGFVSLSRPDTGFNLIYLRTGLETFRPDTMKGDVHGVLVALVVDDIDAEYARIQAEGVPIVTPLQTEPWGERFLQVADPNGVIIQLVQWV